VRIDTHTHSYYSDDGCSSPEKLIKRAVQRKLDGIAITDHDTIVGWKEAEKIAKKYKIFLIKGEEIKSSIDGRFFGDILGLFIKKEIKNRHPKKVIKEIKDQGGIAVIPHPFHLYFPYNFRGNINDFGNLIDGVEVLNARIPSKKADKKALFFAKKNNIAMFGASDAHHFKNVGDAYTMAEEAKNLDDFKKAIFERKIKAGGQKSFFASTIVPGFAKFKIIGRPPKT